MRWLGIVMLGLGTLMLSCTGALAYGWFEFLTTGKTNGYLTTGEPDASLFCVHLCMALFPITLVAVGVALIRLAEDGKRRTCLHGDDAQPVLEGPALSFPDRIRAKVGAFDLNRLNWTGWSLLLATFGFAIAGIALLDTIATALGHPIPRPLPKSLMFAMGLPAFGFFCFVRWLLGRFAISIYRW
jgi:hypothetical protein